MNYNDKLFAMKNWVSDNVFTVDELCAYLSIDTEDIVKHFPDKLVKAYHKTFSYEDNLDDYEDEYEEE